MGDETGSDGIDAEKIAAYLSWLVDVDDPESPDYHHWDFDRRSEHPAWAGIYHFLEVEIETLMEAFDSLAEEELSEARRDLLGFYRMVTRAHVLMKDQFWESFDYPSAKTELGREDPKKMVRIDLGPPSGEPMAMVTLTLDQLREALEGQSAENRGLIEHLISLLEGDMPTVDEIVVCYFNTMKGHMHGTPFDVTLMVSRRLNYAGDILDVSYEELLERGFVPGDSEP